MTGPSRPFILFHPRFVCKFGSERWEYQEYEGVHALAWFKQPCFAIDSDCRRFDLLDVVSPGLAWTIWNLTPGRKGYGRLLKVEFVFGPPEQLTFEQTRDFYVEYCCERRWWSASYETEAQFRRRNAQYTNMRELVETVGLAGRWPDIKKPRKAKRK